MRAVITVTGQDRVGILAKVSTLVAESNGNIIEVSQSVGHGIFTMHMLVEIDNIIVDLKVLSDKLARLGEEIGLKIHCMHEDLFMTMHHI
jgi:ACT domain-containing protein